MNCGIQVWTAGEDKPAKHLPIAVAAQRTVSRWRRLTEQPGFVVPGPGVELLASAF
jgi:hypothetical protein